MDHCYSHAELALTVPFLSYCNVLTGNTFVMFNPYCDILRTFSAGVCPLWGPVHTLVIPWLSAWDVIPSVRRWDGNGVRLVDTSLHMYIYYQYLHYQYYLKGLKDNFISIFFPFQIIFTSQGLFTEISR